MFKLVIPSVLPTIKIEIQVKKKCLNDFHSQSNLYKKRYEDKNILIKSKLNNNLHNFSRT